MNWDKGCRSCRLIYYIPSGVWFNKCMLGCVTALHPALSPKSGFSWTRVPLCRGGLASLL